MNLKKSKESRERERERKREMIEDEVSERGRRLKSSATILGCLVAASDAVVANPLCEQVYGL